MYKTDVDFQLLKKNIKPWGGKPKDILEAV